MKTKKSIIAIGLVLIAAIAAGTVIGVNLTADKKKTPQTPLVFSLTAENHETTISLKKADMINLTLPDYGDGGYIWTILQYDENILHQTDSFQWGGSGMLGDFGKDTWLFTAINPGSTLLELRCQRPFGEQDICQTFNVTITVV
ncbi:MAG: protease inhibitor I42 family protein [Candidatus Thermoplasmatota archaeon]|nr:protease inhibitor I42 family protein [Candidatus Thermoplasmatota archaeon]